MGNLVPGANAALTAENPGLAKVLVGMGWETIPSLGPQAELVPFAVLCDSSGAALSNDHMVFFNQIASADGSVVFAGDDDTEQIDVDLSLVPADVAKIAFIVYVDPDTRGNGTFSSVRSAYIRVATAENRELVRFNVPISAADNITAMMFGELYRHRDDWKFRALGQGYSTGLAGVAKDFRIDT
ncbi:TerD family protein [Arthrobacter sp. 35W]|uniref:TerD family protein n=1 Tax=Arthrobacter sp. 35W TaxID=1132441 RepID=UPI00040C523E|nr:TerD family protein [Arthrobacter sp. 35W]